MGTRYSKAYLLTKVLTASRQEVIVYLYEGAIGNLHRAQQALAAGDRAAAGAAIDKTVNILIELSGSLNYTTGGQLALRLDGIYNYLIEALSLAAGNGDAAAIDACEGILVILHDAWQQACAADKARTPEKPARQLRISA